MPDPPDFRVRTGGVEDLPFVEALASEMVRYSIPPGRSVLLTLLQERVKRAVAVMQSCLENDPNARLLIAETGAGRSIGYLFLALRQIEETTGEPHGVIVDLAVAADYWGKFVWRPLIREAEALTRAEGLTHITGTISVNNPRMLKVVQKFMGYEIERYQVGKVLAPS